MSAGDDVVALVEGCQQNGVEVDRPDPVVSLLEPDVLLDNRLSDGVFFVWPMLAMGVSGSFAAILALRALWGTCRAGMVNVGG